MTLSQRRCFCRPTPGARVLVVLYPAFRADALHAGLLADTRSAGSVSLCAAKLISPTREAVARSPEAPGELNSAAQRQMKSPSETRRAAVLRGVDGTIASLARQCSTCVPKLLR